MKVYVLCPDGRNREEMYIPGFGYLYFNEPLKLYDATYVKMGKHPIEVFEIRRDPQYIAIELDEETESILLDLIRLLKEEKELINRKKKLKIEFENFLKAYNYKNRYLENELKKLKDELETPLSKLRRFIHTL